MKNNNAELLDALEYAYKYIQLTFQVDPRPELQDPRPVPTANEQVMLTALRRTIAKAKGDESWGL